MGRVYFNLAENKNDPEYPFAFLTTYTHQFTSAAKPQHMPLGNAFEAYAGHQNKSALVNLLTPVTNAAEVCSWVKEALDEREIFHPCK